MANGAWREKAVIGSEEKRENDVVPRKRRARGARWAYYSYIIGCPKTKTQVGYGKGGSGKTGER